MKQGRRKGSYVPREMREALMLYLEVGGNRAEVSRKLGISEMTLFRWSKKYSWKEKLKDFDKEWGKVVSDDVLRRMKSEIFMKNPF